MVAYPMIEIVPVTSQQVAGLRALRSPPRPELVPDRLCQLPDVEERGITEALAHDQDCVQSGFRALLQDLLVRHVAC